MKNDENSSLKELSKDRVFYHFLEICKIPHASFHEEKLSNYLYHWAEELGLEVKQDQANNVMIRKPASKGYEHCNTVLLQAHIDMVTEKAPEVVHDFTKDPILPVVEGDILSTNGRTTLGADNGIGVAYAMAILESATILHPPIEVLFTTAEEADFSGAITVDGNWFRAKYLINLDYARDDSILCGSCGGNAVTWHLPVEYEEITEKGSQFAVKIMGLPGGHSGEDIHEGNGNAGVLLGRLLYACQDKVKIKLASLEAGNFRLALPREAHASVWVSEEEKERFFACVQERFIEFQREYAVTAPALSITVEEIEQEKQVLKEEVLRNVLRAIYLSPNGISEMNGAMPGVVESSDNLGEIHLNEKELCLVYEIRTTYESTRIFLNQKLIMLAEILGGTIETFARYPGWMYEPKAKLLQIAKEVYRTEFGKEAKPVVFHAGVESGCLIGKIKGLEAIGLGPNAWSFHSPFERVSISSTKKIYQYLQALLKNLC